MEFEVNDSGQQAVDEGSFAPPMNLAAAAATTTALLAACGGGNEASSGSAASRSGSGVTAGSVSPGTSATAGLGPAVSGYSYAAPISNEEAARFLLQAQFNATEADIVAVKSQGYAVWLAAQLSASAEQTGVQWLDNRGYGTANAATSYFDQHYPADFMIWQQLMKSRDNVRKRMALALSEFFVVSIGSLDVEWRSHAAAQYWDLLVKGTGTNFRTLLEDITLSPAMGLFLNMRGNQKENAQGRQPDENFAREVMQLFSIGLYQLNVDGSEKRAPDGSKLPSYGLDDVTNLARVLTGWDLDYSGNVNNTLYYSGYSRNVGNTSPVLRPMAHNASRHSTLAATFLGTTIAANTAGDNALRTALDTLANHPNVGPFLGKQMIQRLVTSNPSLAYVTRVATVFNNNGEGVRGDMKSVFAAILLDDEARGPQGLSNLTWGKLREPMVRFVQWGRTFGLDSIAGTWKLDQQSNPGEQLGQSPLRPTSVFNFFRPGYIPPSTVLATNGQVAPEFQIVNETTVGTWLNFMQDRIRNGFYVDAPTVPQHTYSGYVPDLVASYAAELPLAPDAAALMARLNLLMCAGQLPAASVSRMVAALNATPVTASSSIAAKLDRICAGVLMVLASTEYLVQK
jgi:uncharacterized protein (DUF1800 family)